LALKHGVTCLNTPGLIDPLYRGELKVLLVNTDPSHAFVIERGDRIAQLVVQRVEHVEWQEVEVLDSTERDTFGFGSTGV
jgi:dUTP pyrophosphatase